RPATPAAQAGQNVLVAESWMIDELAYAGPEHLDAAFVAGFDHKQGYPDPAGDLDALAEQGLGADSTLVDLGTGTGQFALAAARRGAAAGRPRLRLPPGRDRGGLPGLVRARRGGSGRGIHQRGLRRTHPHRVQHLPLAARADAGRGRLRDRGRGVPGPPLRRLYLRQALTRRVARNAATATRARPGRKSQAAGPPTGVCSVVGWVLSFSSGAIGV